MTLKVNIKSTWICDKSLVCAFGHRKHEIKRVEYYHCSNQELVHEKLKPIIL